ncbi:MAG: hypothetical protein A3G87_06965 [Omnitrophica bacterium RIFCSPLOWO2_12_FULL_50_11]|nr:MAG: hypothetical protein A3G87_06965 [Omnitrophica bacterium RIFCSPLOWO2_12_FULL_50_11]
MAEKTVTVFGSGGIQEGSQQWRQAYEVGSFLAKAGFVVVTGGYGGAMTASAQGAKDAGGTTIGVTTNEFSGSVKNEFIDREIRMPTWRERLHELVRLGDGFVVLDGGTGTLAEFMVVWEMENKHLHAKPIAVLGCQMQSFISALKQNPEVRIPKALYLVSTPEAARDYLKASLPNA